MQSCQSWGRRRCRRCRRCRCCTSSSSFSPCCCCCCCRCFCCCFCCCCCRRRRHRIFSFRKENYQPIQRSQLPPFVLQSLEQRTVSAGHELHLEPPPPSPSTRHSPSSIYPTPRRSFCASFLFICCKARSSKWVVGCVTRWANESLQGAARAGRWHIRRGYQGAE